MKYLCIVCAALLSLHCGDANYPAGDFFAVVISDTHVSNDETKIERFQQLSGWINTGSLPDIELLFITGDVVSSVYSAFPDTTDNRLKRAMDTFSKLKIPFFPVMGNHDYKISRNRDSDAYFPEQELRQMEKIWQRYTGLDPFYSHTHNEWHFVILNSMRGRNLHRAFDELQLDWLENQLKISDKLVLFFHHPLETDHYKIWCKPGDLIDEDLEPRFYQLLKNYRQKIKGIFVGHGHRWVHDTLFETIQVYEADSFGDASEPVYYVVGFDQTNETLSAVRNAAPHPNSN